MPLPIPLLTECERVQSTHKLWMLPDLRLVPLTDLHFRWLIANRALVRTDFNLRMPAFNEQDEQVARRWALRHGFVRICYYINGGRLVVDADRRHWTPHRKARVQAVQRKNAALIDSTEITLFDLPVRVP